MAGEQFGLPDPLAYIFGGTSGLSYPELKRRREIAALIAARGRKAPTNLGEGLTYLGESIADRFENQRLSEAEKAQRGVDEAALAPPPAVTATVPLPAPPAPVTAAPPVVVPPNNQGGPVQAPPGLDQNTLFNPARAQDQPYAPAVPPVPAAAPAPTIAPAPRAGGEPPPEIKAIIDARVPPEMRPYYYRMAQKESSYRPDTTSKTGAAGLFQFTRGTGRQYGMEGDQRYNPVASTDAAVRFTEDNTRTLRDRLGREPTWPELALAHQQGAGTAAKMLTGTGNAPAYNLAVNNAGGLGPQAAARKIMGYYGLGGPGAGAGAPPGSRDAIAATLEQQHQGPPTAQEIASEDLLRETVGGRGGGGPLYPPTASVGRAGVLSDASPPGASPLGAVTDPGIGDTLQSRRPTQPIAPPTPGPAFAQNRTRTVPMTATDMPPMALGGGAAPPIMVPGARAAAPVDAIRPAPPPVARPAPMPEPVYPDIGPRPQPPPPTEQMLRDWSVINQPNKYSDEARAIATKRFERGQQVQQEDYRNKREDWEQKARAKQTFELGTKERSEKGALTRAQTAKAEQDIAKEQEESDIRKQFGGVPPNVIFEHMGKSKEAAASGAQQFAAVQVAKNALAGGAITGFGADARLNWSKLTNLMGLEDRGNDIANTEVFRSAMAPVVAGLIKATVGTTNISTSDREFAEKAAGGQITLDAQSIKRLLDVSHRMGVEAVRQHQTKMDALFPGNPQAKALFDVELPIPANHIKRLRDNPDKTADFDEMYGRGAAERVLRGTR